MLISARRPLMVILVVLTGAAAGLWFTTPQTGELPLRDIDGRTYGSLEHPEGKWNVLFFLTEDCPIANQYAPEIQRICNSYGPDGTRCFLVYTDPSLAVDDIRKHMEDFQYRCCAGILDSDHRLVRKAGATISSEAAVFSPGAKLEYLGRIDNFYAALGTPRHRATQHDLRNALDALIAGRSVENPRTEAFGCFIPTLDSEN